MINAGIFDGDQVLVKQQSTAEDGDIVVALIDDGATVKTFHKEKGYYRLQPENDTMEPILVHEGLQILGKVFGVFRHVNSQEDIRNPLRYAALHRIKQVPIHCKLYYINSKNNRGNQVSLDDDI